MGLFSSSTTHTYGQPGGSVINPLTQGIMNNPYLYQQKMGKAGQLAKTALGAFGSGNYTNPFTAAALNSIKDQEANTIATSSDKLTRGVGGLDGNIADKKAELAAGIGNQTAGLANSAVQGGFQQALQAYQTARNAQKEQALNAAGTALNAGNLYNNSFRETKTTSNPSLFSSLSGLAGLAAAPFSGGASLALSGGLSALSKMGAGGGGFEYPGFQYGAINPDAFNYTPNSLYHS